MKFICTHENLLKGLSRVVPVAGRNTQLPVLEHVLCELKEGLLHLTATDLEIGIHTSVPGKVEKEGVVTVVARKLLDYIQQLPSANPITIELKGEAVHISTEGYKARFPIGVSDDFPLLPQLTDAREVVLSGEMLTQGLTRSIFAAARDNTRPEIHSVFIHNVDKHLVLAATDSFRLAEGKIPITGVKDDFSFLLPLTTAQEVVRLFSDRDEITVALGEGHIAFTSTQTELLSRLVDGRYPDYQQIIPTSFSVEGTVEKQEFIRALKTLMVFLPRDSRRVRVAVLPEKGVVRLTTGGGEVGDGDVELAFEGTGEDLEALFNVQYLLDGLSYISQSQVFLQFVGSNEPAVFTGSGDTTDYLYVVMPILAQ